MLMPSWVCRGAPTKRLCIALGMFLAISMFAKPLSAQDVSRNCGAPAPVYAWMQKVVGIKTPNMIASGTMIAANFILTNRHVVEDHAVIAVRTASGDIRSARPIPHDVHLIGPSDPEARAATISFAVPHMKAADIGKKLAEKAIMAGAGYYYAARMFNQMGLDPEAGAVRLSFVHYTSAVDTTKLISALDDALKR